MAPRNINQIDCNKYVAELLTQMGSRKESVSHTMLTRSGMLRNPFDV